MKYSANLGFLWTELKLEEAIIQAKKNNFDAVELQWPYLEDPKVIREVSDKTGLPILPPTTAFILFLFNTCSIILQTVDFPFVPVMTIVFRSLFKR